MQMCATDPERRLLAIAAQIARAAAIGGGAAEGKNRQGARGTGPLCPRSLLVLSVRNDMFDLFCQRGAIRPDGGSRFKAARLGQQARRPEPERELGRGACAV